MVTVINPVRDHHVPWTAVSKVDVVNAVRVHCEPASGAARGKVLYSWAVQSSGRSARKASLRREVSGQARPRLTPRPRALGPPPGTAPRYGELPEPAREALNRSSAEFTAGRLAERAQHARQAASLAAAPPPFGDQAGDGAGDGQVAAESQVTGASQVGGDGLVAGGSQAAGRPVAQWAWLSIGAMIVPLVLLLLVVLV